MWLVRVLCNLAIKAVVYRSAVFSVLYDTLVLFKEKARSSKRPQVSGKQLKGWPRSLNRQLRDHLLLSV